MSWHDRPPVSQRGATFIAVALGASLLVSTGCKEASGGTTSGGTTSGGTTSGGTTSGGVGGSFPVDAGACAPDPLHTGLAPLFNINSVDMDDCPIVERTA